MTNREKFGSPLAEWLEANRISDEDAEAAGLTLEQRRRQAGQHVAVLERDGVKDGTVGAALLAALR